MSTGYAGKFIRINLSTGEIKTEPVSRQAMLDFVGGRGFGISYLYQELPARVDAIGEQNKLIILNGPLAGTSAQSVSRWLVYTKSPLTGALARSSGGGDFGAWLKFAGYDFIIVEGKAEKPVYIHLTKDGCQINDGSQIWGKDTKETQDWLLQQHGKSTRVACIGPAGERLVKYAAIVTGRRTAGRCGVGTVMGSKNLKAIAITAERNIQLHNPEAFKQLVKEQVRLCQESPVFHSFQAAGTTTGSGRINQIGVYPVRNNRYGQMVGFEKIGGAEFQKLRVGNAGCYSCAARCGKVHHVTSGPYAGAHSEGPEYESIWAFTGPIDSTSVEATIAADELCDDLGLDTITAGSTIGFAYELFEKGIITKQDIGGLDLTYGNHSAAIDLIKKIARREGFGNILAEGSYKAGKIIGKGAEAYSMSVKGLEMAAYEPRTAKSCGFNYATSPIGASHGYGNADQELRGNSSPRPVDRFAEEENADIVIYNQNNKAMSEVGIVCSFASKWGWLPSLFGKMLVAATGIDEFADASYLTKVGEKIVNLERAFIVREGFSRKDDTLPQRMQTEPLNTRGAPGDGQVVRELDKFLDRYYELRGWTKDGVPSQLKLKELGLSNLTKDIFPG